MSKTKITSTQQFILLRLDLNQICSNIIKEKVS